MGGVFGTKRPDVALRNKSIKNRRKVSTSWKNQEIRDKRIKNSELTKKKNNRPLKTPFDELERKKKRYKDWRKEVLERDDYRCLDCGQRGGKLNVDHIYPFAHYPRLRFVLENGRTLCERCHKLTPTYGGRSKRKKQSLP